MAKQDNINIVDACKAIKMRDVPGEREFVRSSAAFIVSSYSVSLLKPQKMAVCLEFC